MTEVPHRGGEDQRRPQNGGGMPQVPGEQASGGIPQGPGGQAPAEMPQAPAGPGPQAAARQQSGVEAGAPRAEKASHLAPLLARSEAEKLAERLQHAVTGFVDGPRAAVEEADHVLEDVANRFTEALTQRRRTLRRAWEETDEATPPSSDTERLRLALRDYRELADRLLHH
jgi:hypothetical protein